MSDGALMQILPGGVQQRIRAVTRWVAAVVFGGALGGVIFLIMVQGSFYRGHTELNFNHALGELMRGEEAAVASGREALAVIGDTAGPTGLWATGLFGVLIVIFHSLVITRLVRRPWWVQAAPLALVTFLVLGLVFAPLAGGVEDVESGLFGTGSGGRTPLVLAASALGFAVIASRCYSLVSTAGWWEEKHEGLERGLETVADLEEPATPMAPREDVEVEEVPAAGGRAVRGSLEFPEERPEDGGVGPRG